jgi:iron complex outermembrane receptor protein
MSKISLVAAASVFVLGFAAAAAAQTSPKGGSVTQDTTLGEVVVTATRVESLASKTPIAVTAVSGGNLAAQGITNPTQLAELVPNLSIDRANGLQITIRGVTSTDGTEKGDPSASFLLNGLYIARPQAQEVSFYDIDRVEVLRGPQGTLYGRNTTAGVVNVITHLPTFTYGSSVDVSVGNYGAVQASGMVNLPVSSTFALRVAANYDARNNFLSQAVPQSFSMPKYKDNTSVRVSGLYKPNDKLKFSAVLDYSRILGVQIGPLDSNFYQLPLAPPAAGVRGVDPTYIHQSASAYLSKTYADPVGSYNHDSTWGVQGELSYALTSDWSFTWLGGYRQYNRDDGGNLFIGSVTTGTGQILANVVSPNTFTGNYHQQSQEVRLAYNGSKLKAQAGLYYFTEDYGINFLIYGLQGAPGTRGYVFGFPQMPGGDKSLGVFGQATYSLTDQWRITAGVRESSDDKFRHGATIFHVLPSDPLNFTSSTPPGTTNPNGFADSLNDAEIKTSKATWKVGTDFDLTPDTMLYATVSTGYKAGGFNDGCSAGQPNCNSPLPTGALYYQPETITAYEVGAKTKLLENTLRLTTDYFHYDYNNLQLSQVSNLCGGPCQVTTNAAAAKVDGLELEGLWAATSRSRIDFSATWLDARYADWPVVPGFNFKGARLDRSPTWTMSGGYTYTQPLGGGSTLVANLHSRYSDKYAMLSTGMRGQFWQPAFSKTDVSLTYNAPEARWYIQAFAHNLENSINVTSAAVSVAYPGLQNGGAQIGDPRTYGVRFGAQF